MNIVQPMLEKKKHKSCLEPYFEKVRGNIIPGAFRLQLLLENWLNEGVLNIPSILITGSNGKGTTCAFLESLFREHGLKTGLYTSPHLIHPAERIRINGIPISEQILEEKISLIETMRKKNLPDASFFELTTAIAMLIFLQEKIDVLICEVGLGGHFDSTNALSPMVSVITGVSLEHTQYLGDTLNKIAADKAHIARRNRPFILGQLALEARASIDEVNSKIGANLLDSSRVALISPEIENILVDIKNNRNIYEISKLEHKSEFVKLNIRNVQTALCAFYSFHKECLENKAMTFKISHNLVERAIYNTFWPGRFDVRKIQIGKLEKTLILDASHNSEGFEYFLTQYKNSEFKDSSCIFVFGSLNDKDWKKTLLSLPDFAKYVIFTQIESVRAENADKFIKYLESDSEIVKKRDLSTKISFQTIFDIKEALEYAFLKNESIPILVTGSIALIGTVMEILGLSVFEEMSEKNN